VVIVVVWRVESTGDGVDSEEISVLFQSSMSRRNHMLFVTQDQNQLGVPWADEVFDEVLVGVVRSSTVNMLWSKRRIYDSQVLRALIKYQVPGLLEKEEI